LAGSGHKSMAGGVYYTKESPGRWSKKVDGHLPHFEIEKAGMDTMVRVLTGHEMKGYEHYIVKHVLLDADFGFLQENMFDPMKDKSPISDFKLTGYTGKLYALSMCNKHDVWLNSIEI
ncbi:MAG: hypothetical protein MI864_13730, partial [Pseudomonadales bacterium]|nr:hypothetical protein [Pseudomonadales bacterium]